MFDVDRAVSLYAAAGLVWVEAGFAAVAGLVAILGGSIALDAEAS